MKSIKDYTLESLYSLIGKNVHFISDCEFFPNFNVTIKVSKISNRNNEIIISGKTKTHKSLDIGTNMKNLQLEII